MGVIKIKNKICSFAGHASIDDKEEVKTKLKKAVINLIEKENVITFYSGGKGDFDWLCAHAVHELRKNYPFIKSYWMLAYMPKEKNEFPSWLLPMFDSSVYPNIEKVPKRFAIVKRNEWLVNNSDFRLRKKSKNSF